LLSGNVFLEKNSNFIMCVTMCFICDVGKIADNCD